MNQQSLHKVLCLLVAAVMIITLAPARSILSEGDPADPPAESQPQPQPDLLLTAEGPDESGQTPSPTQTPPPAAASAEPPVKDSPAPEPEEGTAPEPQDGPEPEPEGCPAPEPEDPLAPEPEGDPAPEPQEGPAPEPEDPPAPEPEDPLAPGPEEGSAPEPEGDPEPEPEDPLAPEPEDGLEPEPEDGLEPEPEDGLEPEPEASLTLVRPLALMGPMADPGYSINEEMLLTIYGRVNLDNVEGIYNSIKVTSTGEVIDGTTACGVSNEGTISGGTFRGIVSNDGTISSGSFGGIVINDETISGGNFSNIIELGNNGTISGGNFSNNLKFNNNGAISGGNFSNNLKFNNNGAISGGTFNDAVINSGAISGGNFSEVLSNIGTISGGAFYKAVINGTGGDISGGTFYDGVGNSASISDGTFNCYVGNSGSISDGTFNGDVDSGGTISGGAFNGAVTNTGTISGGTFSGGLSNSGTIESSGNVLLGMTINNASVTILYRADICSDVVPRPTHFTDGSRVLRLSNPQPAVAWMSGARLTWLSGETLHLVKTKWIFGEAIKASDFLLTDGLNSFSPSPVSFKLRDAAGDGSATPPTAAGDYQMVWNTVGYHYSIEPRSVQITPDSHTCTYDGNLHTVSTYTAERAKPGETNSGLMGTDDVTVVLLNNSRKDAGENIITCGEVTMTTGTASNYTFIKNKGTLTIEEKSASITADSLSKSYGDDDPAFTATIEGAVAGETLNYTLNREPGESVGPYDITVTPEKNPNYTLTVHPGTLTITKKAASITADALSKSYGDDDPAFTATVKGAVAGDTLNYTLNREPGESVGPYDITVTPGSNPNYTLTVHPGTLTITKKAASISADSLSKTYGDDDPQLTAKVEGAIAGETLDYSLSRAPGERVGRYAVIVTPGKNPNYAVTVHPGTLTITKKAASITADSLSKTYGKADPALTATVKGLVRGDALRYSLSRAPGERVGRYAVIVTPGKNPNYAVTVHPGTLTITPPPEPASRQPAEPSMTDRTGQAVPLLTERLDALLLISAFPEGTAPDAPWRYRSLSLPADYLHAQAAQGVQLIALQMDGLRLVLPALAGEQSGYTLIVEPVLPGEEAQNEQEALAQNPSAAQRWRVRILKDGKDINKPVPGMELRFETAQPDKLSGKVLYIPASGESALLDAVRLPGLGGEPDYIMCQALLGGLYAAVWE